MPVSGTDSQGWVPVTATFVTDGPQFYEDVQQSITVDFVPPTGSGFTVPFTSPIKFSGVNPSQGGFTVSSPTPLRTPIELKINGPINKPRIVIDNDIVFQLNKQITDDNYAIVDPLDMTVTSRYGVNWSGSIDPDSTYLSELYVGKGTHTAVLTGSDQTASSSVQVRWHNVRASY